MTEQTLLEVGQISTHYGRAQILFELSLTVQSGEVVVLLGRNGAGKSTTLKTLMGLVRASAGQIRFMGQAINNLPAYRIAQMGLGYVPEERRVFPALTILENLEVGRQPPRTDAPHWTPKRLFELFPNLAELQHRPAGQTSGGEQQMLAIARTLMGNPRLILLDEPSEGIAPLLVEQMANVILQLKEEGLTVLISEQNLHFAQIVAVKAVIIESGTGKYVGSFDDLNAKPEIRDAYLTV